MAFHLVKKYKGFNYQSLGGICKMHNGYILFLIYLTPCAKVIRVEYKTLRIIFVIFLTGNSLTFHFLKRFLFAALYLKIH